MSVETTYKKVTQIEHILLRPEMYIGPTIETDETMWLLEDDHFELRNIKYIPGLYKIFDEILVNAADNYRRPGKMTRIDITLSSTTISILNDGQCIPIQLHKQHKVYIPELIFGHLLTSSNYEDSVNKVTGGRNGYGAKLTNIFSNLFEVEVADGENKKKLKIVWQNNMKEMGEVKIDSYGGRAYTKVTFRPDFGKFVQKGFSDSMLAVLMRRAYDIAGILRVKVSVNDKQLPIRGFEQYVRMYVGEGELANDIDKDSERWEVYVGASEGQFQQISFVNGINTSRGGTHVNYIYEQIAEKLIGHHAKKSKNVVIKAFHVRQHIRLFINCLIDNPTFDSQTKETLTTQVGKFGSEYEVSDKLVKTLLKMGILERVLAQARDKENNKIAKELRRSKQNRLMIPKLEDANLAGKGSGCCLILTEGDSAKALAMCGVESIGRDRFGVFPLKGKLANVKEMTPKQVMDNVELANIVKIIGLSFGKVYTSTVELRYGSVMIMADQDTDGSHIKGLVINFLQTFWPSLCAIDGFLKEFVTPIIKCKNGNVEEEFFSQTDYVEWKGRVGGEWRVKYYKGLGTSTAAEAKQYFSNLGKHVIKFHCRTVDDTNALELAFGRKNADARKRWLEEYNPLLNVNYNHKNLNVQDFINKELIHYSICDNIRSIPSLIDGLKPSQRKILFACFKRNLKTEIKVAQLSGYVAEHSAYHHGETSLCGTIIAMSQNYPGSNNLPLLTGVGQFGTRYMGGKDSASARYIYTHLNVLTRLLFPEADDHVVEYLEEENIMIEPKYYVPILPLVLINGCEGIGTGWSTSVYPRRVNDVMEIVRGRICGKVVEKRIGWEGWKGDVSIIGEQKNSYMIRGRFKIDGESVKIVEIPIQRSIRDYKTFLEEKMGSLENNDPDIEEMREYHQNGGVEFVITFVPGKQPTMDELERYLRLTSTLQENNMHLFNREGKIRKYENVGEIMEEYYEVRMEIYRKRKRYLLSRFRREMMVLEEKIRFVKEVIEGVFGMVESKEAWVRRLKERGFRREKEFDRVESSRVEGGKDEEDEERDVKEIHKINKSIGKGKDNDKDRCKDSDKDYNYLLSLPIWSFCREKNEEWKRTRDEVGIIVEYYMATSEEKLWLKDIEEFEQAWWEKQEKDQEDKAQSVSPKKRQSVVKDKSETNGVNVRTNVGRQERKKKNKIDIDIEEESDEEVIQPRKRNRSDDTNSGKQREQSRIKLAGEDKTVRVEEVESENNRRTNEEGEAKPARESIDDILAKYLAPVAGDGNTLEERIRVRIQQGDTIFTGSYLETKEQMEGDNNDNMI